MSFVHGLHGLYRGELLCMAYMGYTEVSSCAWLTLGYTEVAFVEGLLCTPEYLALYNCF